MDRLQDHTVFRSNVPHFPAVDYQHLDSLTRELQTIASLPRRTVNSTPQPTRQSPAFRMLVFGALLVGVTVFVLALHRPHPSELANIKETTDGWWMHQAMPTPQPTPRVLPSPQSRPVLMVQAPPRPAPQPTPKPLSEEELRYRRAIEIGMGADTNTVRELPQVINANGKLPSSPSPNIFAYGAYPQP